MALGLWLGIFVLLVPSITDIIKQCQSEIVENSLAWDIVRILFAYPVMIYCFY